MSTEIQENISPDKTNQITETESTSAKATNNKIKDPRKVAAGKKLAEKKNSERGFEKAKRRSRKRKGEKLLASKYFIHNNSICG